MLFARFALTYHPSFAPITHFEGGGIPGARWDGDTYNNKGVSTEWLRAEKLCTLSGKFHLRWEVPMADVSYYVPSAAIHSFFMFMPFFVIKPQNMIQGFVLWATGPALANYISPDLTEQASIWCFFSISQIVRFFFPASLTMIASTTPPSCSAAPRTSLPPLCAVFIISAHTYFTRVVLHYPKHSLPAPPTSPCFALGHYALYYPERGSCWQQ